MKTAVTDDRTIYFSLKGMENKYVEFQSAAVQHFRRTSQDGDETTGISVRLPIFSASSLTSAQRFVKCIQEGRDGGVIETYLMQFLLPICPEVTTCTVDNGACTWEGNPPHCGTFEQLNNSLFGLAEGLNPVESSDLLAVSIYCLSQMNASTSLLGLESKLLLLLSRR